MSSTNKTANYDLSQYIGSDKPTYLGDYNGDMSKIDTALKTNSDNIETALTNANNAQQSATTALNNAETAQNTANEAQNTANGANGTANQSLQKANTNETSIQTLNQDIDGWLSGICENGASATSGAGIRYRFNRKLNLLSLFGELNGSFTGGATMFKLPSNLKPSETIRIYNSALDYSLGNIILEIDTEGKVHRPSNATDTATSIRLTTMLATVGWFQNQQ